MYIVSADDRLWLQSVQQKLYARSQEKPDYRFEELWGLVTDPRNLRIAFNRVSRNRGARTAGIDRITVRRIVQEGAEEYLVAIRKELRSGSFHPSPVRHHWPYNTGRHTQHILAIHLVIQQIETIARRFLRFGL
jgi:retron-type reverse transcriptase